MYSEAISLDSSWNCTREGQPPSPTEAHDGRHGTAGRGDSPAQSGVGGSNGGSRTCTSMKFRRTPRLHSLLLFRQFRQSGVPSSHFRCLSRHVRHPVLTLLDLVAVGDTGFSPGLVVASSGMVARDWMLPLRCREWPARGVILRGAPASFWRLAGGTSNWSGEILGFMAAG